MRILITGGAGYFGTLLTDELLKRGHECRVFDLNAPDAPLEGMEVIRGDIRDKDAVRKVCQGIDIIHHNVAQVPLAKDKRLFHEVNYDGTAHLLDAALAVGVGKVIYTSSSAVFGVPKNNPVNEQSEPNPMEAYGKAKYQAEHLCHEFVKRGLDISIIRPRTIMGHGRLGIFQILFEWVREGYNVPVLGSGDNVYQFIHASDLASACIKAGETSGPEIFNCGASVFGSMREVLEDLCAYAATGSRVRSLPMAPIVAGMKLTSALGLSPLGAYHSLMYGRSMYFDIEKATKQLNWQPKFSNTEMFIESYKWYLDNRGKVYANAGNSPHKSAVNQRLLGLVKYLL
ncbi:MAG: NAD-dependent epimerase/dehydratase family protein [Gammaproteobacteria bacterium]|nr:NAD-dependent epimerase/dehydratase family protein [Gammaproteobacteria bacterium]